MSGPAPVGRTPLSRVLVGAGVLLLLVAFFTADAMALLWLLEVREQVLFGTLVSGLVFAVLGAALLIFGVRLR